MKATETKTGNYCTADGRCFKIRTLVEADLPALEWDGEYLHFRLLYRGHYQNSLWGNTRIWVAEQEETGEIVGQVFLMLLSRNEETADGVSRAYVFSFRVKPKVRNAGLGAYMLGFVEDYASERGFTHLRINVERANQDARRFYERHGYAVYGKDPGIWDYQDHLGVWHQRIEPAWKMIKTIKASQ